MRDPARITTRASPDAPPSAPPGALPSAPPDAPPGHDVTDAQPPAHAAAATWAAERDLLLRGLNHALSNRVGTLGAVAAMLEPGIPPRGALVDALRDEAERLERLLVLYRLLPEEGDAVPELVHVPDVLSAVLALHAEHPELRDVACEVDAAGAAVPARVAPAALSHALLLALSAAKRAAAPDGRVRLVVAGAGASLRVSAVPERDAVTQEHSPHGDAVDRAVDAALHADAAGRLLAPSGGAALARDDGGVELRLVGFGG
jgi:hypothetical protein